MPSGMVATGVTATLSKMVVHSGLVNEGSADSSSSNNRNSPNTGSRNSTSTSPSPNPIHTTSTNTTTNPSNTNNAATNQGTGASNTGVKVWVKRSKALSGFDMREAALKQQESVIRTSYENQVAQVNRSEQELQIRLAAVAQQRAFLTEHKAWEEQKRRLLLAKSAAKERARREAEGFVDEEFKTPDAASISVFASDQEDGVSTFMPSVAASVSASSISTPLKISRRVRSSEYGQTHAYQSNDFDNENESVSGQVVMEQFSGNLAESGESITSAATIDSSSMALGIESDHVEDNKNQPSITLEAQEFTSTVQSQSTSQSESFIVVPHVRQLMDTTHETQMLEKEMAEQDEHEEEDEEEEDEDDEEEIVAGEKGVNKDESEEDVKVTGLPGTPTFGASLGSRPVTPIAIGSYGATRSNSKRPFAVWASIWFQLQLLVANNAEHFEDVLLAVSPFERKLRFVQNTFSMAENVDAGQSAILSDVKCKVLFEIAFAEVSSLTELTSAPLTPSVNASRKNEADHSGKFALRVKDLPEGKSLFIFRVPMGKERDALLRFLQAGPLQNVFEVASLEFRYPDLTNESDPSLIGDGLSEPTTPVLSPVAGSVDGATEPSTPPRRQSLRGRRPSITTAMNVSSPRASVCAATNFSTWLRPRGHLDPNLWNERVPPFEALLDISPMPCATLRVIGMIQKWRLVIYPLDSAKLATFDKPELDPALALSDPAMDAWTPHERRLMYLARTSTPILSLYLTALQEEDEEEIKSQLQPDSPFVQRIMATDPPGSLLDPNACLFYKYLYLDTEPDNRKSSSIASTSTLFVRLRIMPMPGSSDSTEMSRLATQLSFYIQELGSRGRSRKISQILGSVDAKLPHETSSFLTPLEIPRNHFVSSPSNIPSTPTVESLGASFQ